MKNRKKFIDDINSGQLNINIAYEYYVENGGKADIDLFQQMVGMRSQDVLDTLLRHFTVTKIEDKNGVIIKYC